ncbi:hypothetical protein [Mesorhizobium sp. KR1-2]|uniref:hypothetical protein n=1 Tax=Mesorhizobium sp. KR1-2 TaxID=3156609 RepID=UPI0032B5D590
MSRLLTEDEETELALAIDDLAREVDTLSAFLDGLKTTISSSMTQVQAVFDGFERDAASLTDEVHGMTTLANEAADTIQRAGSEAADALTALNFLLDAAEETASPMFAIADQIEEAATAIREDMEAFVDDWLSSQRDALDAGVLELGSALDEALVEPVAEALDDVLAALTDATDQALAEALQPAADTLTETVEGMLDEIVERLTEGDAETQGVNAAIQPVIDALRQPIEALIDQVERVTPLASMVGMA